MLSLVNISFQTVGNNINSLHVLQNCFSTSSGVEFDQEKQLIYVKFVPNQIDACKQIPKGIKIQVKLNNLLSQFIPTGYFDDFVFGTSNEYTISCSNALCVSLEFWKSTKAQVTLSTFAFTTTVSIGSIIRQQSELSKCTTSASTMDLFNTYIIFYSYMTDECQQQLITGGNMVVTNASIQLQFGSGNLSYLFTSNSSASTYYYNAAQSRMEFRFNFAFQSKQYFYDNAFVKAYMIIFVNKNIDVALYDQTSFYYTTDYPNAFSKAHVQFQTEGVELLPTPNSNGLVYEADVQAQNYDKIEIRLTIYDKKNVLPTLAMSSVYTYAFSENEYFFKCDQQNDPEACYQLLHTYQFSEIGSYASTVRYIFMNSGSVVSKISVQTVSEFADSCFEHAHIYYDRKQTRIEIITNAKSLMCRIATFINATAFIQVETDSGEVTVFTKDLLLNGTTTEILIDTPLTSEQINLFKQHPSRIWFQEVGAYEIDELPIQSAINSDIQQIINYQLLVLIISCTSTLFIVLFYMGIKQCYAAYKGRAKPKIKDIKENDGLD
ncbi:Conserved_hypothetical protein [Hexamita inflata]|uniref:Transmembrane protein n=1 Tax=Hexamita inflata TaxID=28002 RepID=A0AA86TD79_9EUKA|nr:Conserved hypothetical protein [Hexamita inflata]